MALDAFDATLHPLLASGTELFTPLLFLALSFATVGGFDTACVAATATICTSDRDDPAGA